MPKLNQQPTHPTAIGCVIVAFLVAAGPAVRFAGSADGAGAAPATTDGTVDVEIKPDGPTSDVELTGWAMGKSEGWRDAGEGSEIRLTLKPGRYFLILGVYDSVQPQHKDDALVVSLNGHEIGTFRRGKVEGWSTWQATIPSDAVAEGRQVLRFVRKGKPLAVRSVRICDYLPLEPPPAVGAMARTGWNVAAQRFMYAPTFWVTPVEGARSYVATMCVKLGKSQWQAKASAPVPPATGPAALPSSPGSPAPAAVDLAGVWDELPDATRYSAWIEALDGQGRILARTGPFAFHKVASFTGGYRKAARGYAESGRRCAEYVLTTLAAWKTVEPGKAPQVEFPALFYSAYIRVLVTYAEQAPQAPAAAEALATATKIGLHMIKTSTPADWAWPNVPLSHKPGGNLQACRTAMAGMAYLDLLRATGDRRFLDAAMKIADTLKARQLPEGRWHFRVDPLGGKCVEDYSSDQAEALCFLDALVANHGRSDLAAVRDKAVKWMLDNPVRTNYWQQQWDDVGVVGPFHNLEFYDAVFLGLYLLDHATQANGYVEVARGLLRYVEDQFVLWENSFDPTFIAPGVLEQYVCYITIDWHSAHYIRFCMALHQATGEGVYLDKARAMADTLTVIQHVDGYYPTWMRMTPATQPGGLGRIDYSSLWPNCMSYTGEMLMKLGRYIEKTPRRSGVTSGSR